MQNNFEEFVNSIHKEVIADTNITRLTDDELFAYIHQKVSDKLAQKYISITEQVNVEQAVYSRIRGFGMLDELLYDESVTEVMINNYDQIFYEKEGQILLSNKKFENVNQLEDIIARIVGMAGREINQANPIVDTRLPNGSRVNVVLPPISLKGPIVTIRKFSKTPMTIEKLIEYKSFTKEIANKLELLVKAKYNIFISGGTGSGKTTFLNALSNFIPKDERIITIEDSAELQIKNVNNLVSLETRNANSAGIGGITIRDLIKSSLRMRPDRIIVGEVRGGEALDMLQAMNTGHDGSLSTGHANSIYDLMSRLETMVLQGSEGLPLPAIKSQIASSIDIVIQLSRLRDYSRRTIGISEVLSVKDGEVQLNPLWEFVEEEGSTNDLVIGSLTRTKNPLMNVRKLEISGIKTII